MLSDRNSCKRYNTLIVVIDLEKVVGFVFGVWVTRRRGVEGKGLGTTGDCTKDGDI